jgi:ferredoxin
LILLLPVLVLGGVGLGRALSVPLSHLDPNVALAEKLLDPKKAMPPAGVQTPDSLALTRAQENAKDVLAAAVEARVRFATASRWFGGWVGLVIGLKLIGLTLRPGRPDYEPDRGACFGCARCFSYCPNERVRVGLQPLAPAAAPAVAQAKTT